VMFFRPLADKATSREQALNRGDARDICGLSGAKNLGALHRFWPEYN
jgi:hypothetical protein